MFNQSSNGVRIGYETACLSGLPALLREALETSTNLSVPAVGLLGAGVGAAGVVVAVVVEVGAAVIVVAVVGVKEVVVVVVTTAQGVLVFGATFKVWAGKVIEGLMI